MNRLREYRLCKLLIFGFLVRSAFDGVSGQQKNLDEAQKPFVFDRNYREVVR